MENSASWIAHAAWPIALFGICCAFFLIFRRALDSLISRLSKAGRDGVVFDARQSAESAQNAAIDVVTRDLLEIPATSTVLEREKQISSQVDELNLATDSEKVRLLKRVLAIARIDGEFIGISSTIFGSQQRLLLLLASAREGMSVEEVEDVFSDAQRSFPDLHGAFAIDHWLRYLLEVQLIVCIQGRYEITQYGKDFLKYLVDAGLTRERYG